MISIRCQKLPIFWSPLRRTISTELTAALRPFYFVVHPDLFGQYPMQRSVNEESLKQLSAHIESMYERKYHTMHETKTLKFYIRDKDASSRNTFKLIQLKLDQRIRDPKTIVQRLLELCNLSTEHIKNIKGTASSTNLNIVDTATKMGFQKGRDYTYGTEFSGFATHFYQARQAEKRTLSSWILENADTARMRAHELADLREEVTKLQKAVVSRLSLRDARYDCGWNFEHYRGCLKTLERLANMHERHMHVLKGRVVVFAAFTGVSLEGHVMLFTGDVLNNWIDFIKNIPKHDAFLTKVPLYESTLSQVLRNIKIGRRKFMPKQQAVEYAGHLMKVTTTLGDYLTTNKFPKTWPKSLSDFEIVIESEAGPLMLNPTGQLIVPALCPGSILVDFISNHLELAKERKAKYAEQKHIEKELVDRAKNVMKLKSLTKDDSVTADKMIETLRNLLECDAKPFNGIDLHITNYYSVLADGIVCIPWDFSIR